MPNIRKGRRKTKKVEEYAELSKRTEGSIFLA